MESRNLNELNNILTDNIDNILDILQVEYYKNRRYYCGKCPVHNGNNLNGWSLEYSGTRKGNWSCWTKNCHKKLPWGILGLICGIKNISLKDAIKFAISILGNKFIINKDSCNESERIKLEKRLSIFREPVTTERLFTLNYSVPSRYFINRGFSAQILQDFRIGDTTHRAIVPYFNERGVIGYMGRSLWEKCQGCSFYHHPNRKCPQTPEEKVNCSKWKNSFGFNKSSYLYGLWRARPYIERTSSITLVEGSGNVLRACEAGLNTTVGIMGCDLSDAQRALIAGLGVTEVILLMDRDEAGLNATNKIKEELSRAFRVFTPDFSGPDIGAMPVQLIKEELSQYV